MSTREERINQLVYYLRATMKNEPGCTIQRILTLADEFLKSRWEISPGTRKKYLDTVSAILRYELQVHSAKSRV
jgi:hypothetical protein